MGGWPGSRRSARGGAGRAFCRWRLRRGGLRPVQRVVMGAERGSGPAVSGAGACAQGEVGALLRVCGAMLYMWVERTGGAPCASGRANGYARMSKLMGRTYTLCLGLSGKAETLSAALYIAERTGGAPCASAPARPWSIAPYIAERTGGAPCASGRENGCARMSKLIGMGRAYTLCLGLSGKAQTLSAAPYMAERTGGVSCADRANSWRICRSSWAGHIHSALACRAKRNREAPLHTWPNALAARPAQTGRTAARVCRSSLAWEGHTLLHRSGKAQP